MREEATCPRLEEGNQTSPPLATVVELTFTDRDAAIPASAQAVSGCPANKDIPATVRPHQTRTPARKRCPSAAAPLPIVADGCGRVPKLDSGVDEVSVQNLSGGTTQPSFVRTGGKSKVYDSFVVIVALMSEGL